MTLAENTRNYIGSVPVNVMFTMTIHYVESCDRCLRNILTLEIFLQQN